MSPEERSAKSKAAWADRREKVEQVEKLTVIVRTFGIPWMCWYASKAYMSRSREYNQYRFRCSNSESIGQIEYFHTFDELHTFINARIREHQEKPIDD